MSRKTQAILAYSLILLGLIIWLGAIFLAPYLKSRSDQRSAFFYAIFSPVCHQIPSRSFFIFGHSLAVCARCLGVYSGILGGTILFPFFRGFSSLILPKTRTFILFSMPIATDALGNLLHLWRTSAELRFVTGFIWGVILAFYLIVGLTDLFFKLWKQGPVGKDTS